MTIVPFWEGVLLLVVEYDIVQMHMLHTSSIAKTIAFFIEPKPLNNCLLYRKQELLSQDSNLPDKKA